MYKVQAKADLARLAELVEHGANQLVFEKEGRERGAVRLNTMQAEIQRLTEENRILNEERGMEIQRLTEENRVLNEECEVSRTRIAALMDVREVVTAKDTTRANTVADLQEALQESKGEMITSITCISIPHNTQHRPMSCPYPHYFNTQTMAFYCPLLQSFSLQSIHLYLITALHHPSHQICKTDCQYQNQPYNNSPRRTVY